MDNKQTDFYHKLRKDVKKWAEEKVGSQNKWLEYVLVAPDLFHLLTKLVVDKEVPAGKKIKLAAAITYFISPIDLLPEMFLGPIGYLDDVALVALILNELINSVDPKVIRKHWAGEQDILSLVKTIIANADSMLGAGLWQKLKKKFK